MNATVRPAAYRVTFAVLSIGVAAYALLQSLVVPVLSTLQMQLHTTQDTVTWVLTAYLLSASIFTPIMGRLGDIAGKDRIFVVTLAALAVGSLLAATATSIATMIIARAIQGVGGGVVPLAFGIIRDEYPAEKVSGAVGVMAALAAGFAGVGIVLAGPIVNAIGYHWLFWLPMILTTGAAVVAHFVVPKAPIRAPGHISWLPALLLSAWLVALLVALSEGPMWGWVSAKVVVLFVLSAALALAWAVSERKAVSPLIDLDMMRRRAVWTNNLVALLLGLAMYGVFAFLPQFVQTPRSSGYGFGASITQAGLILLPSSIAMFVMGLYAGRLATRVAGRPSLSPAP